MRKREQLFTDAVHNSETGEFVGWRVYCETDDEIYIPSLDMILNRLGGVRGDRRQVAINTKYTGLPTVDECERHIATMEHIIGSESGAGGVVHEATVKRETLLRLKDKLLQFDKDAGMVQRHLEILQKAAKWIANYRKNLVDAEARIDKCEMCLHSQLNPDGGHCYMFKEKPPRQCAQWQQARYGGGGEEG